MSTAGERLEATIWLESACPDLAAHQREEFFTSVDAYYEEHPLAKRLSGALGCIRHDERAFAVTLRSILGEDPPSPPSPIFDLR